MMFEYEYFVDQADVRQHIQDCEGKHTQQAIYSTFHDALTQICYGCGVVRSMIHYSDEKRLKAQGEDEAQDKRITSREIKRL